MQTDIEKAKINFETAKIAWVDLQRFFAAGKVFWVAPELDLTQVALDIAADDTDRVTELLNKSMICLLSDAKASEFYDSGAVLWSVVVKPYVLVQEFD